MWRKKRAILTAVLVLAIASVLMPYGESLPLYGVFASHNYQHTLVLDAGHGGIDGGAVAEDGTAEQDINLAIVKKCQALAGFFGIRTVLTRTDQQSLHYDPANTVRQNKVADIHAREEITNRAENPIFVSVHLNKFSDRQYTGAQVFWSKNNPEGQLLAESVQDQLTLGLQPVRQRTAKQAPDSVYLMKHLTCPAIIVECGFLSNQQETEQLKQDGYQKKLSVCMIQGYLNYLEG